MGSASCTTRLLLRWYLSGDCDYLVILERMISPLTRSARLPDVVVEGIDHAAVSSAPQSASISVLSDTSVGGPSVRPSFDEAEDDRWWQAFGDIDGYVHSSNEFVFFKFLFA